MSTDNHYAFVSRWEFAAPQENVWRELNAPEQWPDWWRGVERVEVLRKVSDELGRGAVRRYTWRSRLPYRLTFTMETTRVEPYTRLDGQASGELEGFGCWQLSHAAGITHVQYDWHVKTNRRWMKWLAPVARPLFEWNHDVVMEWGRIGLSRRLAAALD